MVEGEGKRGVGIPELVHSMLKKGPPSKVRTKFVIDPD